MNISKILVTLVATFSTFAALGAVASDLKFGQDAITIYGTVPENMQVSALVVYSPDPVANPDMKKCKFAEDDYSPNGADAMANFNAVAMPNSYQLKIPLRGVRKSCFYIFTNIYLNMDNRDQVYANLLMESDAQVAADHELEKSLNMELTKFEDFESLAEMKCDTQFGLCYIKDELPQPSYHVSTSAHSIRFDVGYSPRYSP